MHDCLLWRIEMGTHHPQALNPAARDEKREAMVVRSKGATATCTRTSTTIMDVALNTDPSLRVASESDGRHEVHLVLDVWLVIFKLLDVKSILRLRRVRISFQ